MSDNGDVKLDARKRAVTACQDWAKAHGYDDAVVVSWLVIAEVVTPDYRGVVWLGGNGNDPEDEDKAGLQRYQIRGLMSEVEATIRDGNVDHE